MILCSFTDWIDAISNCVIAVVTFLGYVSAWFVLRKRHKILGDYEPEYSHPLNGKIIIHFVNKSRLSTSVSFLGVFLHKNNLKRMKNKRIGTYERFPFRANNKYDKYIDGLNNVDKHSALTIVIPLKDLMRQIKNISYWRSHISNDITNNHTIHFVFAFRDYDDKLMEKVWSIKPGNGLYKIIKKHMPKSITISEHE